MKMMENDGFYYVFIMFVQALSSSIGSYFDETSIGIFGMSLIVGPSAPAYQTTAQ